MKRKSIKRTIPKAITAIIGSLVFLYFSLFLSFNLTASNAVDNTGNDKEAVPQKPVFLSTSVDTIYLPSVGDVDAGFDIYTTSKWKIEADETMETLFNITPKSGRRGKTVNITNKKELEGKIRGVLKVYLLDKDTTFRNVYIIGQRAGGGEEIAETNCHSSQDVQALINNALQEKNSSTKQSYLARLEAMFVSPISSAKLKKYGKSSQKPIPGMYENGEDFINKLSLNIRFEVVESSIVCDENGKIIELGIY